MHTYSDRVCSECGDLNGCHIPAKVKRERRKALYGQPYSQIICLCGSTRFMDAFREANLRETLNGNIVLTVGCDTKSDDALGIPPEAKAMLDDLHLRKIDLADAILVLNVGGYIGESTRREILYAQDHGVMVRYLEPLA